MKALQVVSALLLCSLVAGQASQCASTGSPQLRFVAQLSVSGCALFVHDTGASDGPHLAIEPVMCVTDSLRGALPRVDPVTQQLYVSVPVVLRDAGMLAEARRQLEHLSPRSVSFATVTEISVLVDSNSSSIRNLGLLWTVDEPVATLRLGFFQIEVGSDALKAAYNYWVGQLNSVRFIHTAESLVNFSSNISASPRDGLDRVQLTASMPINGTCLKFNFGVQRQNQSFFDPALQRPKYIVPLCRSIRFFRSINLNTCTARVHQRLDIKGHFLIEPLLCFNISSMSSESVGYDYSRDKHYLKLDLVLQDDASLDAVRTQLADLSPRSVEFMRLWRAESIVSSSLASRYEIGPLMVSADWRSAQLKAFCKNWEQCNGLRNFLQSEPADLWRHLKWRLTSLVASQCLVESSAETSSWRMKSSTEAASCSSVKSCVRLCCSSHCGPGSADLIQVGRDGRCWVKIQQRLTGRVSFQQNWTEYETGFGDSTDFWTGLSAIHSLSAGGATLRLEMKLWNGTELHAEYAGFQVGDASSKYVMTYRQMLTDRSSVGFDAMEHHKGARFSTMDSDNDGISESCSNSWGKGGWWFNTCHYVNLNGLFPSSESANGSYMSWYSGSQLLSVREVRLLLQV